MIDAILKAFAAIMGIPHEWDTDEYQSKYCQEYEPD
jgi:hypothetical protein